MLFSAPPEFLSIVTQSLATTQGPRGKSFASLEAEFLADKLNHISVASQWLRFQWLRFLIDQLYTSQASALQASHANLISTSQTFW